MNKETLKRIDDLRKLVMSKGIVKEEVVEQLVALRPLFIEQKEPLVTRVVRLTAEYIAEHGVFNLNLMAEEDEEGNIPDEELDLDADDSFNLMKENFLYLLDLFEHPDNQVNREELKRVKQMYLNRGMF